MAFEQFPEERFIKTFDTDEEIEGGSFSTADVTELKHIRLQFFKHGTATGLERMRIKIYTDQPGTNLLYTSEWTNVGSVQSESVGKDWIGWIRFDFAREHLNSNLTYYIRVEVDTYTRSGDAFYVGLAWDAPANVYPNGTQRFYDTSLAMQIFGFEERA